MREKKHTAMYLRGLVIGVASAALLAGAVVQPAAALECMVLPAAICGDVGPDNAGNQDGIINILKLGLRIFTAGVGVVAVAAFVYAGIVYASAGDDSGKVTQAKTIIFNAVIGIGAYAFLAVFLNWLIPGGVFN